MTPQVLDLVNRARHKDADAFAGLIEQFERAALGVAYAQLRNAERAGDAVQEGFLRAWQELPRLHDSARFGGWLMQIVRNAAVDLQRRVRPSTPEFPDLAARDATPVEASEKNETAAQIQAALSELDETTRTAVVLRYYDGLSAKEIGEMLDLSPAAVDMRLSRARGQLREHLAGLVGEETPHGSPLPPGGTVPRRKAAQS